VTGQELVIDVLLGLAVAVTLGSTLGLITARDSLDRLHFLTPVSILSTGLVAVAVVAREALDGRGLKALMVLGAFCLLGPVLNQATARALRVRALGDWRLTDEERP
jgi:multisubunit Na+/H+ antiporter MnhG subunit